MEQYTELSKQLLVASTETEGTFGLVAYTLPPFYRGEGLSHHAGHFAGCYVLAGLVAFTSGKATFTLGAGEFVLISPGQPHRCWNPSPNPARLLLLFAPGGDGDELRRLADSLFDPDPGAWDSS